MTKVALWVVMTFSLVQIGCGPRGAVSENRVYVIPQADKEGLSIAFIETPAGSQQTLAFNPKDFSFDTLNYQQGGIRTDYLPYPLASGFLSGGSTDSLEKIPVWVLSRNTLPGDTMSINLLGMIEYRDQGVLKTEFIGIPEDSSLQTVPSTRFRDFIIAYDPVKFMFETWLKNRHGIGSVTQLSWQDEDKATLYLDKLHNKMD